jgi:hypothetical protein
MKPNKNRHYGLVLSGTTFNRKYAFSKRLDIRTHDEPVVDTQELVRLNQLANQPPFCTWQRQRNNDPL